MNEKLKILFNSPTNEMGEKIPFSYLLLWIFDTLTRLLRGTFKKAWMFHCGRNFRCGKNVRLSPKKYLSFGNNVRIDDGVFINALLTGKVVLEDNVHIGPFSRIICDGGYTRWGKELKIGAFSSFNEYCFFGCAGGITIGRNVLGGQYIRFHSENHVFENVDELISNQGVRNVGITVGDNCWIGAGAVFLDGSRIGNGCVVAANAVVSGSFPDNSIIGGIPAKVLKTRK